MSLPQLLTITFWDTRQRQVAEKRQVIRLVISTIKLIGKQGLPARGHRGEAAHYLDDNELNHGNFLELLIEIAKHNDTLKRHIEKSIAQSKQMKEQGSKGWGSFVSFLSATTFSSVVKLLGDS